MAKTKLERAMRKGVFPHQYSFVLDNPIRRGLLNPAGFADGLELDGYESVLEVGAGPGVSVWRSLAGSRVAT